MEAIKYHSILLDIIDKFKRPKWGELLSMSKSFDRVKTYFKPFKTQFTIEFQDDVSLTKRKKLNIGQDHKNIQIKFKDTIYILENVFIGRHSPPKYKGLVNRIHTKGYSEKRPFYYQLVIPLEKELNFHYNIEQTLFSTDLGYRSRYSTKATIKNETIEICCINRNKKDFFLVIDSPVKQTFDEFAEKTNAVNIGLGYLSGYYAGNQGYFFAYTKQDRKVPKHFRFVQLRESIRSSYSPVYSNAYGFLSRGKLAEKYYPLLRPVSLKEFSLLCEKIYSSIEFSTALMLILESSIASLLFMPGGYAIALETMSDIIIGKTKQKLAPIKTKSISRKIRIKFMEVLSEYSALIMPDDLKTLQIRIDQFNQITNKSRLKTPFDILAIILEEEDLKILETRNEFLHGRVPDMTNAGAGRSTDRINKDLYHCSMKFYTLLNMLILKWIGYDNRIVNYPKIHEGFTKIKIDEEPFRLV